MDSNDDAHTPATVEKVISILSPLYFFLNTSLSNVL